MPFTFAATSETPQLCIVEVHGSQGGQQAYKLVSVLLRLLEIKTANKALKPPSQALALSPCSAPETSEGMAVPQHPHVVYACPSVVCPDLRVMDVFILENSSLFADYTCFHLLCFSKEHTHDWKHTHQPAIADYDFYFKIKDMSSCRKYLLLTLEDCDEGNAINRLVFVAGGVMLFSC